MASDRSVDCRKCRHYFVTWQADFPHGCRALGIKSRNIPAIEVLRTSGEPCLAFADKIPSSTG